MYKLCTPFGYFLIFLLSSISHAFSQSVPQLAQKALAATVSLEVRDGRGILIGRGSGFFVRHHLIATNFHVVEGASQASARLVNSETKYTIEGIAALDKTNDLALLEVTESGVNPLSLGDSDKVKIGEAVYVTGNPRGLEGTFSHGIIK